MEDWDDVEQPKLDEEELETSEDGFDVEQTRLDEEELKTSEDGVDREEKVWLEMSELDKEDEEKYEER